MRYLIVIEMEARPKAAERFEDALDGLIVDQTQAGGISALTSEIVEGKEIPRAIERLSGKGKK